LNYSFDLDAIIDTYVQYTLLMRHWHECLPNLILDVNYEDIVKSPERITRKMLKYCELEWDDNCLKSHESNQKIKTASSIQARQPIYTSSVAKWKKYEPYIQDVILKLEDKGIKIK